MSTLVGVYGGRGGGAFTLRERAAAVPLVYTPTSGLFAERRSDRELAVTGGTAVLVFVYVK